MKSVILGAGQGSRLLPLTADRPKCLIECSGRTLIDWQLDSLIANGIDDIAVVVGSRDDQVADALARRGENRARITTIFNPFYKDRKSTRLNSSHYCASSMPSSA